MARSCKFGKLKRPIGRRRCKKAPKKGKKSRARRASTAPMVPEALLNGIFGRRKRRRR